jgi:hypothetical protein
MHVSSLLHASLFLRTSSAAALDLNIASTAGYAHYHDIEEDSSNCASQQVSTMLHAMVLNGEDFLGLKVNMPMVFICAAVH